MRHIDAQASTTNPTSAESALKTIRKLSAAAMMSETSQGKKANNPCKSCLTAGLDCWVFNKQVAKQDSICCWVCKGKGTTGCFAGEEGPPKAEAPNNQPEPEPETKKSKRSKRTETKPKPKTVPQS